MDFDLLLIIKEEEPLSQHRRIITDATRYSICCYNIRIINEIKGELMLDKPSEDDADEAIAGHLVINGC
ncbi:unnamed protein product [Gongylonema pulchrum]|uniref:Uncharacterized protein n=1 Tax=Gongylonema pulchrum TaxID=637853 RepID=A0A183DH73_9BILA|nr:unnamed protein product [Gongylonema pulchrum]